MLDRYGKAYGIKHISLHDFNAAVTLQVKLFGTDYPIDDGSCDGNYVYVQDIARAHLPALQKIDGLSGGAYNLGNGEGYSVKQLIGAERRITGGGYTGRGMPAASGRPGVAFGRLDES